MNNCLLRHISIDYNRGFIVESSGVPNDVKILSDRFSSAISKYVDDYINGSGDFSVKLVDMDASGTFIDKLSVDVEFRNGNLDSYSRYSTLFSRYYRNPAIRKMFGNKAVISIVIYGNKRSIVMNDICSLFSHEMMHAFDDYILRTKLGSSLKDEGKKKNYFKWNTKSEDAVRTVISDFLYATDESEKNSYLSQIYSELKPFSKLLGTYKTAGKIISQTKSYKTFETVKELYDAIMNDDMFCNVEIYSELTGRNFRSVESVRRDVSKRWIKCSEKYLNNVGKIAYELYMVSQDSFIENRKIEKIKLK